jgi:polyhydroxyalkanoate synthesis regulator phasin
MGSSDSFNLFDPSSHASKKQPAKKPNPSPPSPPPTPEQKEKIRENLYKDPELKEWLEKITHQKNELREIWVGLVEKGGHSPQSLKRYLNDLTNFSAEQKKLIQKKKDELDQTLGEQLSPSLKKLKKEKETESETKTRKGKTLGARKKWIDMR